MQRRNASGWLTGFSKDLVCGARTLGKSPGFAALAVITLALGIGTSIACYALYEALLLRSLPFPRPEQLVRFVDVHAQQGTIPFVGQENFRDWQTLNTVFERMAYTERLEVTLTGRGDAQRVMGSAVSEGFFEMLGVQPKLGSWFTLAEQKGGTSCVIIVSDSFWKRELGSRSDAVGGTLRMDDRLCRVSGVMPESFRFNEGYVAEYWTPISYITHRRVQHQYQAYARLKPGVTLEIAQAQMTEIARRLEQVYPENAGWGVRLLSLRRELFRQFGERLAIFSAVAFIVLLVACGNVACLLLARGIDRSKEIAVRVALGADRGHVIRLLVGEGLLLSSMSAAAGSAVALWLIWLVVAAAPPWLALGSIVSVSGTLVIVAVGLTLATGVLASLWPALHSWRGDPQNSLKGSGTGLVAGRRQLRSLHGLVVIEVALAVVLLTFAGLLVKSLAYLQHTDLGYRTDGVLSFKVPLPSSRYSTQAARLGFWDTLLVQLATVPGVLSVAASDSIPMGGTFVAAPVQVDGTNHSDAADGATRGAVVTPDYFRTMGIRLLAGRTFNAADTTAAEPVAIVNDVFVRKLLHGRPAVGARIRFGMQSLRIVGVIADVRYFGPAQDPVAEVYVPYTLFPNLQFVSIHKAVREETVLAAARGIIKRLDSQLPMTQVRTQRQALDSSMSVEREMMTLARISHES